MASAHVILRPKTQPARRADAREGGALPNSYTQNFYHVVFSTGHRENLITPELEERLFPFIGGIVRDLRCTLVAINGMPDHMHLLVRFRNDLAISDLVRHIKSRSSAWIHDTFPGLEDFGWQDGYGGFTVSKSLVPDVEAYIRGQKEHHKRFDFKTEFLELLRRHGIEFDANAVFK